MSSTPSFQRELLGARRAFSIAQLELRSLRLALAPKLFNPNQPRVPAGSPNGGQWVGEGGNDGEARVETVNWPARRSGGIRTIRGRTYETSPTQETLLAATEAHATALVREVQRRDPNWKPRPNLYEGVEGEILAHQATAMQATARLRELRAQEPVCRPLGETSPLSRGGSSDGIYTVPTSEFREMLITVTPGSQIISSPVGYRGQWYLQPDGSIFGIRWSERYGVTLDVIRSNNPLVPNGYKVHQK
ncbi:hypothetical protein AB4097_01770 [Microvirga sp. 2MCAF35]|uniref:hypothetical protein n=1 Tax=Microvirga sp. 2MCAF35 TaxID=3232987 RepID=UPI003F9C523D